MGFRGRCEGGSNYTVILLYLSLLNEVLFKLIMVNRNTFVRI